MNIRSTTTLPSHPAVRSGASLPAKQALNEQQGSTDSVQLSCQDEMEALKTKYKKQILHTGAWMGATLLSLSLGLVAPIVSLPLVATTSAMTIRSVGKAVSLNKQLAEKSEECS